MKLDANRILKNTIALYMRMGVMMLVTLYTSRVVLKALGVDDFGIYNIVGGVAVFLEFLNSSAISATQRFLNFELENGSKQNLRRLFSMCVNIHAIIAGIILVVGEIVGVIVINFYLNIPDGKMYAANWVYQFSLLSFCIVILRAPYEASIIAKEKMGVFAYISIIEGFAKLAVALSLIYAPFNKLIFYAVATMFYTAIICGSFWLYSVKSFDFAKYTPTWDGSLCKKLLNFSLWSLAVDISNVVNAQGTGIALNIFRGIAVNAAMGLAEQINAAMLRFVGNFQVAFAPQITKLYASGNFGDLHKLVKMSAKITLILSTILAIPIILNCNLILEIWLGKYPEFTEGFVVVTILYTITSAINAPMWIAIKATGNIKIYQLIVSAANTLNLLPLILLLHAGVSPVWAFASKIAVNLMTTIWRSYYVSRKISMSGNYYTICVILKFLLIGGLSILLPYIGLKYFGYSVLNGIIFTTLGEIILIAATYFFGLDENEIQAIRMRIARLWAKLSGKVLPNREIKL